MQKTEYENDLELLKSWNDEEADAEVESAYHEIEKLKLRFKEII